MAKIFDRFKKFRKKLGKWFWVVITILVFGVGFLLIKERSKKEVVTFTIQRGVVREELILSGSIKAEKYSLLAFPTSGKVVWVGVSEGQKVNKGQALISLDKTVLNTVYQQALNNLRNYQAAAESAVDSVKDHAADESYTQKATRTAAEVARDNAYDAIKAAEYNLRNSTLFAPFAGLVVSLPFSIPGVNVTLGDTQVEIVDPATIYFEVQADQSEVINTKIGQEVAIVLDSYKNKEIKGKVAYVSYTPITGESGTVYKIKVNLDQKSLGDLLPRIGMTGDAKFILSQKENSLYAPPKFVHSDKDGKYVDLGKKNSKGRVSVGVESEERIEITTGVKEGDILYD